MSASIKKPIQTSQNIVPCDGGGQAGSGHPKIYINLKKDDPTPCPYCGKIYVYTDA
jgi:uncharacterized Zn-finger protein